jgi:hypothetical protein
MRRKVNNKLKEYLLEFAGDKTIDELLPLVNEEFNENYDRLHLQKYIIRNRIPYKYSNPEKIRDMSNLPIGTERVKDRDRIYVKVAKNKWIYKQRYIYEQYHKVKLTSNDFIVFLDGDKTNFNIDNLYKITRYEAAHLGNICGNSKSKDVRRVSIDVARLMIKIKDWEKEYEKTRN